MNKLDEIKTKVKKKPSVYLEDVDISAIAMTSGAGACSQMNDPYILKSKDFDLTEDQIEILKEIGEYDNVMENIKKQKEEIMDEKVIKELEDQKKTNEDLQKKLDEAMQILEDTRIEKTKIEVEKSLDGISFEGEIKKEISAVMVKLEKEDREIIVKAFTDLEGKIKVEEENTLQKELSQEVGATGEEPVEKSLNDRISAYRK